MRQNVRSDYIQETKRAAIRLGLPSHGPTADAAIVEYCRREVSRLTARHGLPTTMGELLERVASCLDVEFVEIHSDDDLARLLQRIPPTAEPMMARVAAELDDDTDGITIKRLSPQEWERRYLAVINCRGWHHSRRFFTKWHELAHRLVDGEQLGLAFRQTLSERKEPGEMLVDKIAGEIAFSPQIVAPNAYDCLSEIGLTFESVDALRQAVAPEASRQATALALIRYTKLPAWYLRCTNSLKLSEARAALAGKITDKLVPKLRVTQVSPNDAAAQSGVRIHQWMRVPESGVVALSHRSGLDHAGSEPLEEWETSSGGPIGFGQLFVDTQVVGEEVLALVSISRN